MKVLCRCVRAPTRAEPTHRTPSQPALTYRWLLPSLDAGSRGITNDSVQTLMAGRPNVKIMGATEPEALKKYTESDKVLCF